jgi:hypothetical protein
MSTEYFLQIDNQQAGPFTLQQIGAMVGDRSVPVTTLFWKEGQADWEPLTQLGFEPPRMPPAPRGGSGPPPLPAGAPPPLRNQSQSRPVPPSQPEISRHAILCLILGLASFVFSLITAIPAVIYGHISLNEIRESRGSLTGRGLAITGMVVGYVCLCVIPILLAVIAVPVFVGVKTGMLETRSMNQAKQISAACHSYAADNDGEFPPSLITLVPKYLPDRSLFSSPIYPADPDGYTYHSGLNADSPPSTVLIEDKYAPAKRVRVIVMVDGSCKVVRPQAGAPF